MKRRERARRIAREMLTSVPGAGRCVRCAGHSTVQTTRWSEPGFVAETKDAPCSLCGGTGLITGEEHQAYMAWVVARLVDNGWAR